MKKIFSSVLALTLCLVGITGAFDGAIAEAASTNIKMIVTNPGENASTQMNVGFHAPLSYTNCYVQYTTTNDTSWASAKTNKGTYKSYGASSSSNPFYGKSAKDDAGNNITQSMTFLDYNVNLTGLTPNTKYMYRIYDGSAYSDVYYFKTAANDGSSWSFVVTGDFHEYYKNYGVYRAAQATKAINAGISLAGQLGWSPVEHVVSVGDIVAWGVDYGQWQNVLNQPWIKNYSFANAIGNHDDMDRNSNSSSAYNSIVFNNPLNGYNSGDEMGTVFYYVYNNVLFIYVNYLKASVAAQETWAQSVVDKMKGSYKYITLVNHRPATNKYTGSSYSYFWNYWADFCDKNHVDLVLAGDHHVYMRSQPIYNGSMLSGYSASKPDATVYIAADSSDGERGSSTDVTSSFSSSWVKSNYYRYDYSGSTKDKTSIIINVTPDKMTTQFIYFEDISSASHPSWKQGTVSGHSNFYYGDVSYVYPSNHGYTGANPSPDPEPEPDPGDNGGLPLAKTNFLSGGQYKYSTSVYPGGASYYTYEYYGDGSSQGGSFMTGKLNNGTLPANSNPGSSNTDWATFFLSQGDPQVYLKLSEAAYLNKINVVYRNDGNFYGDAIVSNVGVSTVDSGYATVTDYTTSISTVNGSNYMVTLTFTKPINAAYVSLTFAHPGSPATRLALGEIEVWGDTVLPVTEVFELVEDSPCGLDKDYFTASAPLSDAANIKKQFACTVTIVDADGKTVDDTKVIGTGFKIKHIKNDEVLNEVTVVIPGDVSSDGQVSSADYITAKQFISSKTSLTGAFAKAADANCDGDVGAADYIYIKGHCAGTTEIGK